MNKMREDLKIEGKQVFIRPITIEDTDLVLKWRNSEKVVKNFIYRKEVTREDHLNWIHNKVEKGRVHQFIVCSKIDDMPIGVVYLQDFDEDCKKAESGIFLGEIYGKGIGTEAYKLLLDYAFGELKLHKVVARVLAGNEASVKLHIKTGYTQEAYLKDELFLDSKYEDLIMFGVINNNGK